MKSLHRLALIGLACATPSWGQGVAALQDPEPATLRNVIVAGTETHVIIALVGDQPLNGQLRELTDPPYRVFIDLENVVPQVDPVTPVARGAVERVRVALNQPQPPITRVVLDLRHPSSYRLEREPATGTLRIVVGPESPTPGPEPANPAPSPPGPAETPGSDPTQAAYVEWFTETTTTIQRLLERSRSAHLAPPPEVGAEPVPAWDAVRHELKTVSVPPRFQVAHDLLGASVSLGSLVASQGGGGNPEDVKAGLTGATMFLQRARTLVARPELATPADVR